MALEPTLIKPRDLPEATEVFAADDMIVDNGVTVNRANPVQVVNAGSPVASEAEAIAGTNNTNRMTPLRVAQAIGGTAIIADAVQTNNFSSPQALNPVVLYVSLTGADPTDTSLSWLLHGLTPETAFRTWEAALAHAKYRHRFIGRLNTVELRFGPGYWGFFSLGSNFEQADDNYPFAIKITHADDADWPVFRGVTVGTWQPTYVYATGINATYFFCVRTNQMNVYDVKINNDAAVTRCFQGALGGTIRLFGDIEVLGPATYSAGFLYGQRGGEISLENGDVDPPFPRFNLIGAGNITSPYKYYIVQGSGVFAGGNGYAELTYADKFYRDETSFSPQNETDNAFVKLNTTVGLSDVDDMTDLVARGGGIVDEDASIDGVFETQADLRLQFDPGVTVKQTKRSVVGAFLTNVVIGDAADRIQSHIEIDGGIISGEDYPAPEVYAVVTHGAETVTLPSGASSVSGYYVGMFIQVLDGVTAGNFTSRLITAYNGTTKVITATPALSGPQIPPIGSFVQIGYNDNAVGFAWGGENIRIRDGISKDYPMSAMTPPGLGGKGLNFEQGTKDAVVSGRTFENCYTGLYVNAHPGDHTNGYPKWVQAIRASDLHFEMCGSAITAGILDGIAAIPDDPALLQASISNFTYHNCGHAPLRIVGSDQQKSGIINLMGAYGLLISDGLGYNDASYVTDAGGYPTDFAARSGYGLTGPIGAVIWGHARATTIRNIQHSGDADAAVHIGRVRALGDDAPPSGVVSTLIGWNIDGLSVYGAVGKIVSRDTTVGFNANQIFGHWRIAVTSATLLLDTGLTTGTGWTLELTEIPTGKTVIGTAAQILARGNTFADYPSGTTDLRTQDRRTFTIADDAVASFTPISATGILTLSSATNLLQNVVRYETDPTPQCDLFLATVNTAATTGVLTGTTGSDGNFTISAASDGKVYLENRRGSSVTVTITIPVAS